MNYCYVECKSHWLMTHWLIKHPFSDIMSRSLYETLPTTSLVSVYTAVAQLFVPLIAKQHETRRKNTYCKIPTAIFYLFLASNSRWKAMAYVPAYTTNQRIPNVVTYESSILSKQGEIETFPFRLSFNLLNHSSYITRQLEVLPGVY